VTVTSVRRLLPLTCLAADSSLGRSFAGLRPTGSDSRRCWEIQRTTSDSQRPTATLWSGRPDGRIVKSPPGGARMAEQRPSRAADSTLSRRPDQGRYLALRDIRPMRTTVPNACHVLRRATGCTWRRIAPMRRRPPASATRRAPFERLLLRRLLLRFRLFGDAAHHAWRRWMVGPSRRSTFRASYALTSAAGLSPSNMTTSPNAT
jgi:hypothetical protein